MTTLTTTDAPTTTWRTYVSIGFLANGVFTLIGVLPFSASLGWLYFLITALSLIGPAYGVLSLGNFQGRPGGLGFSRTGRILVLLTSAFYVFSALTDDDYYMSSTGASWGAGLLASLGGLFLTLSLIGSGILLLRARTASVFAGVALFLVALLEAFETLTAMPKWPFAINNTVLVVYGIGYLLAGIAYLIPRKKSL